MVTLVYSGAINKYRGLSTDDKPDSINGSEFLEMDTGDVYYYDGDGENWSKISADAQ